MIETNIFAFHNQPINKQTKKNAPCPKVWIIYHHAFLKHSAEWLCVTWNFATKVYLKNTGWSLYDVVSCEKLSSSPLTTSIESMLPFSFACLCDEKEMTGLGSLRLLTCLGKLHVTSAPGDFLTKKRSHTQWSYSYFSQWLQKDCIYTITVSLVSSNAH